MITNQKCRKLGLEKQSRKLLEQMRKNNKVFLTPGSAIETMFTENNVEQAFSDLGVNFISVKGKKWYEFDKDDWDEKVYNSLRAMSV